MTVRPGPHDPVASTPARAPSSIRRTTSVDLLRPHGLTGSLVLFGAARDLATDDDGRSREVGHAAATIEVDFMDTLVVTAIASTPVEPQLQSLVGLRVLSGFRTGCRATLGDGNHGRQLLRALLDDVPVTTVVSGHVLAAAGIVGYRKGRPRRGDVCAGWANDGEPMRSALRTGLPVPVAGPPAPPLTRDEDPDGWHHLGPLPPHSMRRVRRVDVVAGDPLRVDAMFRDVHVDQAGAVTVIHEYSLAGTVDPDGLVVAELDATPRVLPFAECPAAAASATRLVGVRLDEVRSVVRAAEGPSTCTHLNDLLRAIPEVADLASERRAPRA